MNVYGLELSYNNREEWFTFPIMPSSIEIGEGNNGKTYDISKMGEINVIQARKLTTFRFSGLFPNQSYPFVGTAWQSPIVYLNYLDRWMDSKRPIRFKFLSDTYEINTPAYIESFSWKEVAGSGGDIEYTLQLKKYVFYAARKVVVIPVSPDVQTVQEVAPPRLDDRVPPSTYTLVDGDSLWKVAKKQLGDDSRWKEIQHLNGLSDAQLKSLPVGLKLNLPTTGGTALA